MKKFSRLFTCLCLFIGLQSANAATVEVDVIPGGGVDPTVTVAPSDTFTVDIVVESISDLAGFDISLGFDDSILSAVSLTSGFIFGPDDPGCLFAVVPGTCILSSTIGPGGTLNEADISTDFVGFSGSGILFSIEFTAIGVGTSPLTIDFIDVSDAIGDPIILAGTFDGSVTVEVSAVPLPGAMWLLLSGLVGLVGAGKYRRKA